MFGVVQRVDFTRHVRPSVANHSMCLSVIVSAVLELNISETRPDSGAVPMDIGQPIGTCLWYIDWACS